LSSEETLLIEVDEQSASFVDELATHPSVQRVVGSNGGYKVITAKGEDLFSYVFNVAKENNVKVRGVHVQTPTLEDVFLHLTGRKLRD
jgi:ABC-2 type transport system ATP-binding protein